MRRASPNQRDTETGDACDDDRVPDGTRDDPRDASPYWLGYTPLPQDFFMLDRLGEGARGVVYRAIDRDSRVWAVKCMDKKNIARDSIEREIRVLRLVRGSLNVACLYAVYEDEHRVYLVMEFVTNGHVAVSSEKDVCKVIRSVCRILKRLHDHSIVHRDIKPSNFLMDDYGHVKAIDFGSAIPLGEKSGIEGTPLFMAPEALNGHPVTQSDIWSVGVMAYFLVSGRFPYRDARPLHKQRLVHVMRSILEDPLRMEGDVWDTVSDHAKDFIHQCLTRDLATRMTVHECLVHPWLTSVSSKRATPYDHAMIKRLQKWTTFDQKKQTFLHLLAHQMCDARESMSMTDIVESIRDAGYRVSESDVETLVETLGDGTYIKTSTFVAAQLDTTDTTVRRAAYRIFDALTLDGMTIETKHGTIHRRDMERMFDTNTTFHAFSSRDSLCDE